MKLASIFLTYRRVVAALAILVLFSSALPARGDLDHAWGDADQWLRTMGFEDISKQIAKNLKTQRREVEEKKRKQIGAGILSEDVLKFSQKRYNVMNEARDLASIIYSYNYDKLRDPKKREQVLELASRLLTLQPKYAPDKFPPQVRTQKQKEAYWAALTVENMNATSEKLVSDIVDTTFGDAADKILKLPATDPTRMQAEFDLKVIRRHVSDYIEILYSDYEINQTRYVGTALSLLLARYARTHDGADGLEESLRAHVADKHLNLDNFITRNFHVTDAKGNDVTMRIDNGSFVYEYSGGQQASEIASALRPNWRLMPKAYMYNVIGHLAALLIPVSPGKGHLTTFDKVKIWLAERPFASSGISHTGMAFVNSDAKTGLEATWIYDMYPDAENGSVRVIRPEGFALKGPFRRFAVSRYDAKKFAAHALEQARTQGYIEGQWESFVVKQNAKGDLSPTKQKYTWKVEITKAEYDRLMELAAKDPERWFEKEIVPRVRAEWNSFLTEKGLAFASGFMNGEGMSEASKGDFLSIALSTGINPQKYPDRFALPVKILKILHLAKAKIGKLDVFGPIIAPNTFMLQPMSEKPQIVDYAPLNFAAQKGALYSSEYIEFNPDLTARLRTVKSSSSILDPSYRNDLIYHLRAFAQARDLTNQVLQPNFARNPMQEEQARNIINSGSQLKTAFDLSPVTLRADDQPGQLRQTLDSFFQRIGYENFSAEITQNLKNKTALSQIGTNVLKDNQRRYIVLNVTRDLSAELLAQAYPRMQDAAFRNKMMLLTGKLMSLQPMQPPLRIPEYIKSRGPEGLDEYLIDVGRQNIQKQTAALTADYIGTFYSKAEAKGFQTLIDSGKPTPQAFQYQKNVSLVTRLFGDYLKRIYLDPQVGQTKWLGRALVSGLLRYGKLYDPTVKTDLRKTAKLFNLHLENFEGVTLVLNTVDGPQKVDVKTGDLAYERTRSFESAMITAAALPAKSAKKGVRGWFLEAVLALTNKAKEKGLSTLDYARAYLNQKADLSAGMSHVGQFAVFEDEETGIKQSFIFDNYPYPHDFNKNWGGVRMLGLEHFANPGEVMRFGIAKYDINAMFAEAQLTRAQGKPTDVWPAFEPSHDEDGNLIAKSNPQPHNWTNNQSQASFDYLYSRPTPKEFFAEYERLIKRGHIDGITKEGIWFFWLDMGAGLDETGVYRKAVYLYGGTYCSMWIVLNSLRQTALNLEPLHGEFNPVLKEAMKLGLPVPKEIDFAGRISPPTNLAVQDVVHGGMLQFNYPAEDLTGQAHKLFEPPYVPEDPTLISLVYANREANRRLRAINHFPLDKAERLAFVDGSREFIENLNLELGQNRAQIFGAATDPGAPAAEAALVPVEAKGKATAIDTAVKTPGKLIIAGQKILKLGHDCIERLSGIGRR